MKNRRISELQNEAYSLCRVINDEGKNVVLTDEWYRKFAELLIKDCIDGLLDAYGPDDCLPQEEIAGFLKDRFGIEE